MSDENVIANVPDVVLSSVDEERFNELMYDRQANAAVFNQFLQQHTNSLRNIEERRNKIWAHCAQAYGLSKGRKYSTEYSKLEGRMVIVDKGLETQSD